MKHTILIAAAAAMLMPLGAGAYTRHAGAPGQGSVKTMAVRSRTADAPKGRSIAREQEAPVTVPFTHTLGKNEQEVTNTYTVIDANNDAKTWKPGGFTAYSVCMKPTADDVDAMDDWLVSPGVQLTAGTTYTATIEVGRALSSGTKERFAMYLGADATVEAMTQTVMAPFEYTNRDFEPVTATFTVATSGVYHFGLHATSAKADSGNMKICNFSVTEADDPAEQVTPAAAGTLEVTLFPKGELKAHVKYTAPTLNTAGEPLAAIDKVQITNRWYEKFDYENVAPGEVIELDVDLFTGVSNNRVEGVAYLSDGKGGYVAGESVLVTGICGGPDTPLAPTNAKATLSADGKHVTVTWDAPGAVGENGGYVDVDNLTYYIFDAFGSYYDPALAETHETSYTFDYSELTSQDFVAYQITCGQGDYYSLDVSTNIVTVGEPDAMPFLESFSDSSFANLWAVDPQSSYYVMAGTVPDNYLQTNTGDEGADPVYLNSQDGDNGFFFITPMNKDDMYGLMSVKVSMQGAERPVLEFFYQGQGSALDALVSADGGDYTVARTIDLQQNPTTGWTLCRIDLAPYKNAAYIQFELRLRAIHNDDTHTWSVPIDNIRVRNLVDNDLCLAALDAPKTAATPGDVVLTARVQNLGAQASASAQIDLYRNGVKVGSQTLEALEPEAQMAVTFTDAVRLDDPDNITYKACIVADLDEVAANNEAEAAVTVIMPKYPTVENLQVAIDGAQVILTWDPVVLDAQQPETMTDDFEDPAYPAFSITGFGDWTVYDGDGLTNYKFLDDVKNPYRAAEAAWQLFDMYESGIPEDQYVDAQPHSGSRMLVAWSCPKTNDNWLISPQLSGDAQTISFFARSFTIAWAESFAVYYSTTDAQPGSFTKLADVAEVPETWTEFTYSLPEGAKYFAVVHNAYDTYALYLDDATFTPASTLPADLALLGYNVYRNGTLLNAEPVQTTNYVDHLTRADVNTYRVSAVYNYGESRHSDAAEASGLSAVESIAAPADSAEYYTIDGLKADASRLAPGIYVRRTATGASKVVVK